VNIGKGLGHKGKIPWDANFISGVFLGMFAPSLLKTSRMLGPINSHQSSVLVIQDIRQAMAPC
jgi:hypothetical protein